MRLLSAVQPAWFGRWRLTNSSLAVCRKGTRLMPKRLRTNRIATDTAPAATGAQLGYARVSTGHQSLDQQVDALTGAGVETARVYSDKLSGMSTREQRPGLAALLAYAREGDAIVVVGIDRLGRDAAEVMTTIRELGGRMIVLRSLREGIDTSNATGRMVAGVLASLAELELELGRERRTAAREARRARGQSIGRPKSLDESKAALALEGGGGGEGIRSHLGEPYGPGFYAFGELLAQWRAAGNMQGMELTS